MLNVLYGALGGFGVAWVLTLLGIDQVIIKGAYQLFNLNISNEAFYCIFVILGLIFSFVKD